MIKYTNLIQLQMQLNARPRDIKKTERYAAHEPILIHLSPLIQFIQPLHSHFSVCVFLRCVIDNWISSCNHQGSSSETDMLFVFVGCCSTGKYGYEEILFWINVDVEKRHWSYIFSSRAYIYRSVIFCSELIPYLVTDLSPSSFS